MIYSKFSYEKFDTDFLGKINEYLKNNDLSRFETGKHDIDKDNMFLVINDYKTVKDDERVWEAHRRYIDVHVMIKGKERLGMSFIEDANIKQYHEDSDYVEIPSVNKDISQIILREGEYLVCYPQDVHKTACIVENQEDVRKAIFKVKVKGE